MAGQKYWVGLDTGVAETAVCLIDEFGEILFEGKRETHAGQIKDILRPFGVEAVQRITIEAGVGTHMVRELQAQGFPVYVAEVRRAAKFLAIRRQKTDSNDARGLADLGRVGRTIGAEVFMKPLDCQNLRSLLNVRKNLIQQRMKIDALAQSIVRLHGGKLKTSSGVGGLASGIEDQLEVLRADGLDVDADVRPLISIAENLRSHIAGMDKRHQLPWLRCDRDLCAYGAGILAALVVQRLREDQLLPLNPNQGELAAADRGWSLGIAGEIAEHSFRHPGPKAANLHLNIVIGLELVGRRIKHDLPGSQRRIRNS